MVQVHKFWTAFDSLVDVMFVMDLLIQFLFTYTSELLGLAAQCSPAQLRKGMEAFPCSSNAL